MSYMSVSSDKLRSNVRSVGEHALKEHNEGSPSRRSCHNLSGMLSSVEQGYECNRESAEADFKAYSLGKNPISNIAKVQVLQQKDDIRRRSSYGDNSTDYLGILRSSENPGPSDIGGMRYWLWNRNSNVIAGHYSLQNRLIMYLDSTKQVIRCYVTLLVGTPILTETLFVSREISEWVITLLSIRYSSANCLLGLLTQISQLSRGGKSLKISRPLCWLRQYKHPTKQMTLQNFLEHSGKELN